MKRLYAPPPLFGLEFLRMPAEEVEVVAVDIPSSRSLVRRRLSPKSVIGILLLREQPDRQLPLVESWVPTEHLQPVPTVHA